MQIGLTIINKSLYINISKLKLGNVHKKTFVLVKVKINVINN